ncbi:MAG: tetratricopeptide repeat protein [bacterium]
MVRLSFSQGTDEYRAYQTLLGLVSSDSALDTGCHRLNYSSESDGPIAGASDQKINACEVWGNLTERFQSASPSLQTYFGEAPVWILPPQSTDKSLQAKIQKIDAEIKRLQNLYKGDVDGELKIAKGLYQLMVDPEPAGLGITTTDVVRENTPSEALVQKQANCSELFATFKAIFERAGLKVKPYFVFESATGDKAFHVAAGYEFGGKTYLMDPFYNNFDTAHRKFAPLTLREFWAWHFNNKAKLEADAGHLAQAVSYFASARRLDASNPHFPNNLGLVLADAGKSKEAEAAYRQSMTIDSQFVEPYVNLGSLMIDGKRYKEALVPLSQGLQIQSNDKRILYNLASAHYELGNYKSALGFIDKALQIDKNNQDFQNLRRSILIHTV